MSISLYVTYNNTKYNYIFKKLSNKILFSLNIKYMVDIGYY